MKFGHMATSAPHSDFIVNQGIKNSKFYYLKVVRSLNVGIDTIINQSFLPSDAMKDDWCRLQEEKIIKIHAIS